MRARPLGRAYRTRVCRPDPSIGRRADMQTDAPSDLSRSRIFDGLTENERATWLSESLACQVRRGETLARQGEPAHCFYLVETGFLKLVQVTADGRELIVRFVGPREPFAGIVALDQADYPVTALAVESTRMRAWPRDVLMRLLERFPVVRTNIMREIARHMNDALTRVRELTTDRVGQRLAHTLLRLMRQCGQPTPDGILISHPLTRQELAALTGTTLYTVSRTLSQWEAEGLLRSERRRLLVRSPRGLETLSRSDDD
ncbi:MAG: cyclic nucleotide-binding domain-containing protein [Luteitalea sp.]|nr:cyclic nucleotide-binding domain-containing protein [Luteitalea sp.]